MNFGYTLYQAERTMSRAERRAVDIQRGEMAAALSRLRRRNRQRGPVTTVAAHPTVPDCACALIATELDGAHVR
jgi:hypothetical protein